MTISASPVSAAPVSAGSAGLADVTILIRSQLVAIPFPSNQEILESTDRRILVFAAELQPAVLSR